MGSNNEQWLKNMKDRLEHYEEPVPEGLWDSLEEELTPKVASVPFRWKRVAVAASAAVLLVGALSGWLLGLQHPDTVQYARTCSQTLQPAGPDAQPALPAVNASSDEVAAQPATLRKSALADKRPVRPALATTYRSAQIPDNDIAVTGTSDNQADASVNPTDTLHTEIASEPEAQGMRSRATRSGYTRSAYTAKTPPPHRNKQQWSLALAYGNTPGRGGNVYSGIGTLNMSNTNSCGPLHSGMAAPDDPHSPHRVPQLALGSGTNSKTEINHKTPVTAGVSFRYRLAKGFSVETGLDYTLLSSELYAGNDKGYFKETYKLHYLGIPLKVSWQFLDTRFLSLYVSAGGELEKSLAGKYRREMAGSLESERWSDNVKPVQWSVLGALGIQFNATKRVGIFAEPGVVYYFDDGSDVQTIRKEKPLNFKLQLGVRWTY